MDIPEDFLKPYNPATSEQTMYELWMQSGFFNPDNLDAGAEPFSIALPPPNATGTLHIGHAFEQTLQDIVARYQRMRGKRVLWLPGTDHAAIAVNTKVEKELVRKEGKNRHDIGRDAFVTRVEDFVAESRGTIQGQIKRVGGSVDWGREAFTFDDARNKAVRTAFKRMYDAGLIYRGYRVINWDPKGQTSVSDDEVEHRAEKGFLYTFKYSADFPIPIATTRPETKVGDTGVAVHPDDPRYAKYIGKEYDIEFAKTRLHIKVVGDACVDPAFGTGAVGVTPAHSMADADIAQRHDLPMHAVINEYAKMNTDAGALIEGLKTTVAREKIVEWLKKHDLLEKTENIDQNIAIADRSGGTIEPLPKLQWFINAHNPIADRGDATLKELMLTAVQSGEITILPERFEKIYFNWIDNLRDWCISRQLWYGHRIPVWYKGDKVCCDTEPPKEDGWEQDPDTLDTWFSSALWTFSTLGWPEETVDLKTFHPTSFMAPGYEILFFWVARMILMSTFLLGEIPFKFVYLHGMVRDQQGRKFSKSLNNGVDPLEVIDAFGADALRMSLVVGVGPGNDSNFDLNKVKGYKHFANKLWNASRFVLYSTKHIPLATKPKLIATDQKYLADLAGIIQDVSLDMENYRLHIVAEKLYHYFWHTFADVIIEETKKRIQEEDAEASASAVWTIQHILVTSLKLLHPFMPFVTETIWQKLDDSIRGSDQTLLMIAPWPTE